MSNNNLEPIPGGGMAESGPVLRWVKASERLPDSSDNICLKVDGKTRTIGWHFTLPQYDYWVITQSLEHIADDRVEWLEEVPSLDRQREPEKAEGGLFALDGYFRCQREVEMQTPCTSQCDHCREYCKPLDSPAATPSNKPECTCLCGPTDANPSCTWPNCYKPEQAAAPSDKSVVPGLDYKPEFEDDILHAVREAAYGEFKRSGLFHAMREKIVALQASLESMKQERDEYRHELKAAYDIMHNHYLRGGTPKASQLDKISDLLKKYPSPTNTEQK